MRVAVCISGQLRKWKVGHHNQKWFWSTVNQPNVQVDYFGHTWTYSGDRQGVSQPYINREVKEEEFLEFANAFKFKKILFDDRRTPFFYNNDHWSSLFYSLSKSLMLKREYEIENNFTYDVVVKSRPDVVFDPGKHFEIPHLFDNCIHSTHGGTMPMEFNKFNFNDCVFLGNSYTMDLLTNLYFYRQAGINENTKGNKNIHPIGPGTLMMDYFSEYGITPFFDLYFQETLLKKGCPEGLNLFDRADFMKMNQYFRDWYTK